MATGEATRSSNRGGRRPGAGRPRGAPGGGPSQETQARWRAWVREFGRALRGDDLAEAHATLTRLAEAAGFRPPPPLT